MSLEIQKETMMSHEAYIKRGVPFTLDKTAGRNCDTNEHVQWRNLVSKKVRVVPVLA